MLFFLPLPCIALHSFEYSFFASTILGSTDFNWQAENRKNHLNDIRDIVNETADKRVPKGRHFKPRSGYLMNR